MLYLLSLAEILRVRLMGTFFSEVDNTCWKGFLGIKLLAKMVSKIQLQGG